MPTDSWDRVAEKRTDEHRNRLVPVEVIEQGEALPSNSRTRMTPRPEAKERQINKAGCTKRGELAGWRRRESEHMSLDSLAQPVVHAETVAIEFR